MIRAAHFLIFGLAASLAWAGEPCRTVEGERILARDLAAVLGEFSSVAPETPVGYAPTPGARRILRFLELQRLAVRFGVTLSTTGDICFELAMETLVEDQIIKAMRAVPELARAHIEISDFSRYPVPRGKIEFPRQGLPTVSNPGAGVLWKGYVLYPENRKFAIWAKASISVPLKKVIAVETLKADRPIEAAQLRLEEYEGLPSAQPQAKELDQVVGRVPRRAISAGSEILLRLIAQPTAIARGEAVDVEVRSGAARLDFTGRAESGGGPGDTILVRNPRSGKSFQALVSAKGRVLVIASPPTSSESSGESQ